MKKMKFLSTILLAVMTMSTMIACSGSDDEDGGGVSYTESEIIELLSGTWEVYGELKEVESETGKRLEGTYTGKIEFKANQKISRSFTSNCTRNDFHIEGENDNSLMNSMINNVIGSYYSYKIIKKDGKIFIAFNNDNYYFEIRSLNKNTFKFVLDEDIEYNGTIYGHVYMTVVSK